MHWVQEQQGPCSDRVGHVGIFETLVEKILKRVFFLVGRDVDELCFFSDFLLGGQLEIFEGYLAPVVGKRKWQVLG